MRLSFTKIITIIFIMASSALVAQKNENADNFSLRPSTSGGQTGYFNAKGLPTALKINGEWVLPRGGTMEWLMTKGYVPDKERANIMVPNPHDKRYKKTRPIHLPPLATTPVDFISSGISPRWKKNNDPFAGLADPMKRKFSPQSGAGSSVGIPAGKNALGPILDDGNGLPTLQNTPFAPPAKVILPGKQPAADGTDPFLNETDNPVNPEPKGNLNELPGKPIDILPRNDNPLEPAKPGA